MVFLVPLKPGDYLLRTADNRCAHLHLFLFQFYSWRRYFRRHRSSSPRRTFARLFSVRSFFFSLAKTATGKHEPICDPKYTKVSYARGHTHYSHKHTHTHSTLLSTHFKVDDQRNSIVLNAVFRFYDKNERTTLTKMENKTYLLKMSYFVWLTNCTQKLSGGDSMRSPISSDDGAVGAGGGRKWRRIFLRRVHREMSFS